MQLRQRLRANFAAHPRLAWLGQRLHEPELWHWGRRAVANGLAAGLFIALLPVPGQMALAACAAVLLRANLPLAVAATWISNPLTFAPISVLAYTVGTWVTGTTASMQTLSLDGGLTNVLHLLTQVGKPYLLGSLVCAAGTGVASNVLVRVVWRTRLLWRRRRKAARA